MSDDRYMQRAVELAESVPFTSPNPRVGAVIVAGEEIVGEGFHRGAGTPHAEVVALQSAKRVADDRGQGATLYVTLEPCVHHGRTPPCADAVIAAGIRKVVIALEDPDERVSGRGIAQLRDAGIDCVVGVGSALAERVNEGYLHHRRTGRPLLRLKLAMSIDGCLAPADDRSHAATGPRWITGERARRVVHMRRAQVDAVMVGAGTVLADDPSLTVRDVPSPLSRQPARVVVDTRGRVPDTAKVFADGEVLVATTASCPRTVRLRWQERGAEVLVLPRYERGVDLAALVDEFGERGWHEVMCEGGAELATSLLARDLVDRLEIHRAPVVLGAGLTLGDVGVKAMDDAQRWLLISTQQEGEDVISIYERRRA